MKKLFIKNMVCARCIMTVKNILHNKDLAFDEVTLGEAHLVNNITTEELKDLDKQLHAVGFEIIESRSTRVIEDVKKRVMEYIALGIDGQDIKLSSFITEKIAYDYSYLSDLFSSIEGKTIEQFFILQRIEKVKELIVYDQLSLTEISYQTGFSSVHHLSSQFKKITGLSPSHFRKIAGDKRKSLDSL